jgi:hypothetical protein
LQVISDEGGNASDATHTWALSSLDDGADDDEEKKEINLENMWCHAEARCDDVSVIVIQACRSTCSTRSKETKKVEKLRNRRETWICAEEDVRKRHTHIYNRRKK